MENEKKEDGKISNRCSVKYSDVCSFLGCDGCEKCILYKSSVHEYEKVRTNEIWQVTKRNLPNNADEMHKSEECLFCKKRPGNQKIGYAIVDIAHPDPPHEKGPIFGLGRAARVPVGSMLPLPVAICKDCKRRFTVIDNLKYYSLVVGLFVALLIILIFQNSDYLQYSPEYISIVLVLFVMGIFYIAGGWYAKRLVEKQKDLTYFNLFDIPEMQGFGDRGWFVFENDKEKTRFLFSKKKPRRNFKFFWGEAKKPEKLPPEDTDE